MPIFHGPPNCVPLIKYTHIHSFYLLHLFHDPNQEYQRKQQILVSQIKMQLLSLLPNHLYMLGIPTPTIKYLHLPIFLIMLPQILAALPLFHDVDFLLPLSMFIDSQQPNQMQPHLERNYKPKELHRKLLTWATNDKQFYYP